MPMGRKQKKWMSLYMALVLTVTVGATTAFAAGDPLSVINNLSTFIFSLIRAIGLILLGFGVVQVGLSLKSHDPSQRANGFLTLAGGVIITDWAAMDNIQNEQFKITVNILSRNLRADCLKVAVFKRVLRDGKWVNDTADRRLAGEIENAILTQARKLYRRDLAAREE